MKVNPNGFALIFALIVIVIAGSLLTGLLFNANTTLSITDNDLKAARASSLSKIGLKRFQTIAHQSYAFFVDHWQDYSLTDEQLEELQCGAVNLLKYGLDTDRLRDGPYDGRVGNNTRTLDVLTDQPFEEKMTLPDGAQGGYAITLANDGSALESIGYLGESLAAATSRSKTRVSFSKGFGSNPYGNAIFVGGPKGNVSGSTAIYGSVQTIGSPTNGVALDIANDGGIYNNYFGRSGQVDSDISAVIEELTSISANSPPDLCTKIKVKDGDINRNGISPIGWRDDNINDDITFEVAALYLAGRLLGSVPYTRKDPESYDDTVDVSMPKIPSDYPNDISSAVYIPDCTDFADDISSSTFDLSSVDVGDVCFSNDSFIAWLADSALCSSLISALGASFTIGMIPTLIEAIKSSSSDSDNKLLCFNGTINTGNLNLVLDDISYQGQGAIRVGETASEANIDIFGSITPLNKDFPTGSVLGLVSNHNINITPTNVDTRQAFIAFTEDAINISEQTVIAGSLVAGKIQATGVPKIAYVPGVEEVARELAGLPQLSGLGSSEELGMVAYE